jgi:hypothetical protein
MFGLLGKFACTFYHLNNYILHFKLSVHNAVLIAMYLHYFCNQYRHDIILADHLHMHILLLNFLFPLLSGSAKLSSNSVVVDHTVICVCHKKEKKNNFLFSRKQTKRMVEEGCQRLQTRKGSIYPMCINKKSTLNQTCYITFNRSCYLTNC